MDGCPGTTVPKGCAAGKRPPGREAGPQSGLPRAQEVCRMRIVDIREVTQPIASPIRNAYIDFSKMTTS
ncbi:MAG: hypothetical protein ACJ8H8_35885, partial [Geminicoccaceae bacterium]